MEGAVRSLPNTRHVGISQGSLSVNLTSFPARLHRRPNSGLNFVPSGTILCASESRGRFLRAEGSKSAPGFDRKLKEGQRFDRRKAGRCAYGPENSLFTDEEDNKNLEKLRKQLEEIQQELDDTNDRASGARARFVRLTRAVEQLKQSAANAMSLGDEQGARSTLVEKARVVQALERARQRAEILETLAKKLSQVVSGLETRVIASLSSARVASSPASSDSPVRVVGPASRDTRGRFDVPRGEVWSREESLKEATDEELSSEFLEMEKGDLERLFNISAGFQDAGDFENQVGRGAKPSTAEVGSQSGVRVDAGAQKEEEGRAGKLRQLASLLAEVDEKLLRVQVKLKALERVASTEAGSRWSSANGTLDAASIHEAKMANTRDSLSELMSLKATLLEKLKATAAPEEDEPSAPGTGKDRRAVSETFGNKTPGSQQVAESSSPGASGSPDVLLAVVFFRQKYLKEAAASLHLWLRGAAQSEPKTWAATAEEFPWARLEPREAMALYTAYLEHHVLPHFTADKAAATWEPRSSTQNETQRQAMDSLQALQEFLGITKEEAARAHEDFWEASLHMCATGGNAEGAMCQLESLRIALQVPLNYAASLQERAENVRKLQKLTAVIFNELQRSGSKRLQWRDATWRLQDRHEQELVRAASSLQLDAASAATAVIGSAAEFCEDLAEQAVEALRRGQPGSSAETAGFMEGLLAFIKGAAASAVRAVDPSGPALLMSAAEIPELPPGSLAGHMASHESEEPIVASEAGQASAGVERGASDSETERQEAPDWSKEGYLQLVQVKRRGYGEREALFTCYCSEMLTRVAARALYEGTVYGERSQSTSATSLDVDFAELALVLGLSAEAKERLRGQSAAKVYCESFQAAADRAAVTALPWAKLSLLREALGISPGDAQKIHGGITSQTVGSTCRALLDKRTRGGDITAMDIQNLAALCARLGAMGVAGIDTRDRMVLIRRAVQVALDSSTAMSQDPDAAVATCRLTLKTLKQAFQMAPQDVEGVIAEVSRESASRALLQARASLRRGERQLATADLAWLVAALSMYPREGLTAPGGKLPASEAIELYELYLRSNTISDRSHQLDVRTRLQVFLGL